jgi:rubredoxin
MITSIVIAVPVVLVALVLRWALFVRVRVVHAPYCPVCGESRGRFLGVGESSNQAYLRCPHCGHVFEEGE